MVHPGTDVFCRNVGIWGHVPWVVGRLQVRSRDSEVIRLVRDRLQRGTGASRMGRLTVAKGGGYRGSASGEGWLTSSTLF